MHVCYCMGETWPDVWLMGALFHIYAYYTISFPFVHEHDILMYAVVPYYYGAITWLQDDDI